MASVLRLDETSVANEALALAEQPAIASLTTDRGKSAETCRTFFASIVRILQTGYKWNGMSRWIELPEAADAVPNPDFKNAYRLPVDVLRIIDVRGAGREYRRMGGYLYCNVADKVSIEVIQLLTNPAEWDERFRAVFVAMLAYKIAPRLGCSEARIADLRQEQEALARRMKRVDADEGGIDPAPHGTWLSSRHGGGRW